MPPTYQYVPASSSKSLENACLNWRPLQFLPLEGNLMQNQVVPWQWSLGIWRADFFWHMQTKRDDGLYDAQDSAAVTSDCHKHIPSGGFWSHHHWRLNLHQPTLRLLYIKELEGSKQAQETSLRWSTWICLTLQASGHSIILTGDLNEPLGDGPAGMSHLVSECQWNDAISDCHGPIQFTRSKRP